MYKNQISPPQQIAPVAGDRRDVRLLAGVYKRYVQVVPQAQVDITGAFANRRNRGSVFGIFDQLGISENGRDTFLMDGPSLRFLSEILSPSALPVRRLAGVGVQAATIIREPATLCLTNPLLGNPSEVSWRERDPGTETRLFARMLAAPIAGLAGEGGGVGAVSAVSIDVLEEADRLSSVKPFWRPFIWQQVTPVGGANPQQEIKLDVELPLLGVIVKQEADSGEVGDIIASLAMRSDTRDIVGPNQATWRSLTMRQQRLFGGDVFTDGVALGQNGFLFVNFLEGGRLGNIADAPREPNLRIEANVAASAQPGATNGRIRTTLIGLERVAGVTADVVPVQI